MLINHGTGLPEFAAELSARLAAQGIASVDAHVSGGHPAAAGPWDLILQLVGAGVGVRIVPAAISHPTIAEPTPSVLLKPLADIELERHLHLAIPSVGELAPAVTRFIDEVWHLRNDQPSQPAGDGTTGSST